jgi:hypothetical protein
MFCLKQGTAKKGLQCLRKLQLATLFTQNRMSQYGIVSRKSVQKMFFRRLSALEQKSFIQLTSQSVCGGLIWGS